MLGDDPDSSVTTDRVWVRGSFGRAQRGWWLCREGGHLDERGKQRQWGLTKGHGDKGGFVGLGEREKRGVQLV